MEKTLSRRSFASLMATAGAVGVLTSVTGSVSATTALAGEAASALFTPGTYSATVRSIGGPMTAEVTLSDSAIERIDVTESHDSDGIIENVVAQITKEVVDHQSLNVDSVTGATMSSLYLKQAISDAVAQGAANVDALQNTAPFVAEAQEDMDVDVVVVGGGIAGIATAAMAADKGLKVALVEKNAFVGGNALLCEGVLLGSLTEPISSRFDEALELITSYGAQYYQIPTDSFVLPKYYFDVVEDTSAMSTIIRMFTDRATAAGAVLFTNNEAQGLVVENGKVVGVTVQPKGQDAYTIRAQAVVLATGGFSANADLVTQYMPQYEGIHPGGLRGATGDALSWIEAVDGQTVMLDSDAQFYNSNPSTGSRATTGSNYPLYVDSNGNPFTDSAYYTDAAHAAWESFGNETYYAVITDEEVEATKTRWFMEHMLEAQDSFEYPSISGIAADYNLPNLEESAADYGYEPEGAYYLSPCQATIYATYGGILIDEQGSVLNNDDKPIPGLYACGEVIGSQNFQQNGMYVGQLGPSITMGMVIAENIAATIQA